MSPHRELEAPHERTYSQHTDRSELGIIFTLHKIQKGHRDLWDPSENQRAETPTGEMRG